MDAEIEWTSKYRYSPSLLQLNFGITRVFDHISFRSWAWVAYWTRLPSGLIEVISWPKHITNV